jgi:NitT/TauT family transport system substrate-binding protein
MEGAFMSCCDTGANAGPISASTAPTAETLLAKAIERRTVLKGMVGTVAGFVLGGSGFSLAQNRRIRLAFCSQLLCVVPYEFTRAQGFFEDEGLNVELVYTRGGGAALQALVGGAVEYAATSFDAALQAYSNGAEIRRFATSGRLPLFALATAPRRADEITDFADLAGRTVGVSALGNGDHVLMLYLLERAGVDPRSVQFATLGVNLYDALRLGQVDAGWVQEPSLTLIREAGGGVLFNAMDIEQARRYLGGAYEFMGVAVRADELDQRLEEMRALSRALEQGLIALKQVPASELVAALPPELVAGGDLAQLEQILEEHRDSLYPDTVNIDVQAVERVVESQRTAGVLEEPVDLSVLLATGVLGGNGG